MKVGIYLVRRGMTLRTNLTWCDSSADSFDPELSRVAQQAGLDVMSQLCRYLLHLRIYGLSTGQDYRLWIKEKKTQISNKTRTHAIYAGTE